LAATAALPAHAQDPLGKSGIQGTVRVRGGKLVARLFVTAQSTDLDRPPDQRRGGGVWTAADGTFKITGIDDGAYRLCVFGPADEVLDPCQWSDAPPVVRVPVAGVATDVEVEVPRGKTLRIRLDDPDDVVPTPSRARADAYVQFGARSAAGVFHQARLVSSDGRGHNYELVVPPNADLEFVADARNLDLSDEMGTRVQPGRGVGLKSDDATLKKEMRFRAKKAQP
jgi:hypothetical protein